MRRATGSTIVANRSEPGPDVDGGADAELGSELGDENGAGDISPVDFNMLVLSLNASALMHLGEPSSSDAAPSAGPVERQLDLPMARNAIDMLCMLETKTRGNLTGEEERLLNQVLFDLRLRYARAVGG